MGGGGGSKARAQLHSLSRLIELGQLQNCDSSLATLCMDVKDGLREVQVCCRETVKGCSDGAIR